MARAFEEHAIVKTAVEKSYGGQIYRKGHLGTIVDIHPRYPVYEVEFTFPVFAVLTYEEDELEGVSFDGQIPPALIK